MIKGTFIYLLQTTNQIKSTFTPDPNLHKPLFTPDPYLHSPCADGDDDGENNGDNYDNDGDNGDDDDDDDNGNGDDDDDDVKWALPVGGFALCTVWHFAHFTRYIISMCFEH